MNKKGFTLMELIITIAILGTISLIAVPSITGIQNRTQIKSDKLTGAQIGKAFLIKDIDAGNAGLTLNEQIKYDTIEDMGVYISGEYTPTTMQDGYFVISQVEVNGTKIIMVGITKDGAIIGPKDLYENGTKPGWVWSQGGEIEKFLAENGDNIQVGGSTETEEIETFTITASSNVSGGISDSGANEVNISTSKSFFAEAEIDTTDTIYKFKNWVVDGVETADEGSYMYRFSNVQADHTIRAVYTATSKYKLTVGLDDLMQMETNFEPGESITIESSTSSYNVSGIENQSGTGFGFTMPSNAVEIMGTSE